MRRPARDDRARLAHVGRDDELRRAGWLSDRGAYRYDAPIVSASLGLPATFLWGGATRTDRPHGQPD